MFIRSIFCYLSCEKLYRTLIASPRLAFWPHTYISIPNLCYKYAGFATVSAIGSSAVLRRWFFLLVSVPILLRKGYGGFGKMWLCFTK